VPDHNGIVNGTAVAKASHGGTPASAGTFGAFRQPRMVGVSDAVRIANNDLARRARREMRAWKRSLPKGVRI
jgi:hypothetical protein